MVDKVYQTTRRVLVVSHPCVIAENQAIYVALQEHDWDVHLAVPNRWRGDYSHDREIHPKAHDGLRTPLHEIPVLLAGNVQGHIYRCHPGRLLEELRPDVLFIELEMFSLPAVQWGLAATHIGLPFGVQAEENQDRRLPVLARCARHTVASRASFVVARTPTARSLAIKWGATGNVQVVPHVIPNWTAVPERQETSRPFTIGYAGRLVPQKGVLDLVTAFQALEPPVRLLVIGSGPLRGALQEPSLKGTEIEIRNDVTHDRMWAAYDDMDVLVLPSRTTAGWSEQFGRVLVEAMSRGVPVLGSSSGEIPWLINLTGGGQVFPEGDVAAITGALTRLRNDPERRKVLGSRGTRAAAKLFSPAAGAKALDDLLRLTLAK